MPENITVIGWNATWTRASRGHKKVITDQNHQMFEGEIAYEVSDATVATENAGKCMKNLHNWFETVDQLAISIAIILELVCFIMKESEDSVGRWAVLELLGKRVFGNVYPSLVEVVSQGSIEDDLKVVRGGDY
jgi:hypothetical protein